MMATFPTDRTPEGLVYSETCRMVYFGKSAFAAGGTRMGQRPVWNRHRP